MNNPLAGMEYSAAALRNLSEHMQILFEHRGGWRWYMCRLLVKKWVRSPQMEKLGAITECSSLQM